MQGWQITVAELMFRGFTEEQIIAEIWPEKTEEKQIHAAKARLRNLRKDEKFQEYYRSIITEWSVHNVGKALTKLAAQIDDPNGWLANKAANDVLTQSKAFTGSDESTVLVKVEGMPELGVPEED